MTLFIYLLVQQMFLRISHIPDLRLSTADRWVNKSDVISSLKELTGRSILTDLMSQYVKDMKYQ